MYSVFLLEMRRHKMFFDMWADIVEDLAKPLTRRVAMFHLMPCVEIQHRETPYHRATARIEKILSIRIPHTLEFTRVERYQCGSRVKENIFVDARVSEHGDCFGCVCESQEPG
jgi:hypothetical protein